MKRQLLMLAFIPFLLMGCYNSQENTDTNEISTTVDTIYSEASLKTLKFGDLLDSLKKIKTPKSLQKTLLSFKLGMTKSAYEREYNKLNMYEYAPGRMAYDINFKNDQNAMASACEFDPEFKQGKLNKLTINISSSSTDYSHEELKTLLNERYKTDPVEYDYPSNQFDALWIKDGLLVGLLKAKEGGIKVDVLSFSYAQDMKDEYAFMDKKKSTKSGKEAFN
jgi:hypothetical protein